MITAINFTSIIIQTYSIVSIGFGVFTLILSSSYFQRFSWRKALDAMACQLFKKGVGLVFATTFIYSFWFADSAKVFWKINMWIPLLCSLVLWKRKWLENNRIRKAIAWILLLSPLFITIYTLFLFLVFDHPTTMRFSYAGLWKVLYSSMYDAILFTVMAVVFEFIRSFMNKDRSLKNSK